MAQSRDQMVERRVPISRRWGHVCCMWPLRSVLACALLLAPCTAPKDQVIPAVPPAIAQILSFTGQPCGTHFWVCNTEHPSCHFLAQWSSSTMTSANLKMEGPLKVRVNKHLLRSIRIATGDEDALIQAESTINILIRWQRQRAFMRKDRTITSVEDISDGADNITQCC